MHKNSRIVAEYPHEMRISSTSDAVGTPRLCPFVRRWRKYRKRKESVCTGHQRGHRGNAQIFCGRGFAGTIYNLQPVKEFARHSGNNLALEIYRKESAIRMCKKPKTQAEILQNIRRDWGNVKPFTRKFPDKTKYNRKTKHKGNSKTDCSFS